MKKIITLLLLFALSNVSAQIVRKTVWVPIFNTVNGKALMPTVEYVDSVVLANAGGGTPLTFLPYSYPGADANGKLISTPFSYKNEIYTLQHAKTGYTNGVVVQNTSTDQSAYVGVGWVAADGTTGLTAVYCPGTFVEPSLRYTSIIGPLGSTNYKQNLNIVTNSSNAGIDGDINIGTHISPIYRTIQIHCDAVGENVGIMTETPKNTLDVNGGITTRFLMKYENASTIPAAPASGCIIYSTGNKLHYLCAGGTDTALP